MLPTPCHDPSEADEIGKSIRENPRAALASHRDPALAQGMRRVRA